MPYVSVTFRKMKIWNILPTKSQGRHSCFINTGVKQKEMLFILFENVIFTKISKTVKKGLGQNQQPDFSPMPSRTFTLACFTNVLINDLKMLKHEQKDSILDVSLWISWLESAHVKKQTALCRYMNILTLLLHHDHRVSDDDDVDWRHY